MKRDAQGESGVVTSAHPYASQSGLSVLKRGGNAIDAAVATAFTLGVVLPAFSGVGGGGFMLIHLAKTAENIIVDYRERAPKVATPDMFSIGENGEVVNRENQMGYKSVAVPGTPAGLAMALERYGTMPMREVAQDAIGYAKDGFEVSELLGSITLHNMDRALDKLGANAEAHRLLLKRDESTYKVGEKLVLKDTGNTIEKIANNGSREFYEGFVAEALVRDMAESGGLIGEDDLRDYEPKVREPLTAEYKGFQIATMPPPSSGGVTLVQLLKMLGDIDLRSKGFNTAETIDLMARAFDKANAGRQRLSDPDFAKAPVEELVSDAFIAKLKEESFSGRASRKSDISDSSQTTHLSVVDREGNVVALTESLDCYFGSGVVVPGTGILLNDTMHDFDPRPGRMNSIQPGKRPVSSMAPTIFFKDGAPFMVLGSAAGPRIITAVLQVALNVLEHGMNIQDAIVAPRVHFQGGQTNTILVEKMLPARVRGELADRGYQIAVRDDFDFFFGGVHAITLTGGTLRGGADPRRDGVALAY